MKYHINPDILRALQIQKNHTIEAMQFKRNNFDELKKFTNGQANSFRIEKRLDGKCTCFIDSLNKRHIVYEGDYIIKGLPGEYTRMGKAMFEAAYKAVN